MFGKQSSSHGGELNTSIFSFISFYGNVSKIRSFFSAFKSRLSECDLAIHSRPSRPPTVNRTLVCASNTDKCAYSKTKQSHVPFLILSLEFSSVFGLHAFIHEMLICQLSAVVREGTVSPQPLESRFQQRSEQPSTVGCAGDGIWGKERQTGQKEFQGRKDCP